LDQSTIIRVEHLRAALALWAYCRESAESIFGDATPQPTVDGGTLLRMIEGILTALQATPDGISRTDLHGTFGNNTKRADLQAALDWLTKLGLACSVKMPGSSRGGPKPEYWFAGGLPPAAADDRSIAA
jgi:hypothetical protein